MKLTNLNSKKYQNYFTNQKDILLVYLYGSQAKGTARKTSDIDLGVVFEPRPASYNRIFQITSDLQNINPKLNLDVRELFLADSPVFLNSVISSANLIYERSFQKRINFEISVRHIYDDTQNGRDIQFSYSKRRLYAS